MRTITLELLRHGPPHNQLVSPLTPYLALCENHGAVTVHLPFEHNQLMHRLSALEYRESDDARQFQLQDTAKVMGSILDQIPGLKAEIKRPGNKLTHLRLIVSASELALLPFELALSPSGCPGAGQNLLLQTQSPVCLTREVRRATDDVLPPPETFKILFAAASPASVGPVPLEAHLLALRRAVDPWVKHFDPNDDTERRKRVTEHLVVLPNASIESIREACASDTFTHIHILAHGVRQQIGDNWEFCLALHDPRDPAETDCVSGPRLATALTASRKPAVRVDGYRAQDPTATQPYFVSLASCNGGSVGSVAGAGASIAHALHESGIPMVVAGQFPLSVKGSVHLVETLFRGLLWAEDPRWLLQSLRRELRTDFSDTHDWASLTAYAALPAGFDRPLCDLRIRRTVKSIDAAMDIADKVSESSSEDPQREDRQPHLEAACARVQEATKELERLLDELPTDGARICGLLGSTRKRHAELLYWTRNALTQEMVDLLQQARRHYREAFRRDRSFGWALVQHVSLTLLLANLKSVDHRKGDGTGPDTAGQPDRKVKPKVEGLPDKAELDALMATARLLSEEDLHDPRATGDQRIWSYGNLMELELLTLFHEKDRDASKDENTNEFKEVTRRVLEYARSASRMVEAMDSRFEAYTTVRQLRRFKTWYGAVAEVPKPVTALAEKAANCFPSDLGRWS